MRTFRLCLPCLYPLGFSLLIAGLFIGTGQAESPGTSSETDAVAFTAGVQAYRRGDYPTADRVFGELHKQAPQDARVTYYLAITAAQQERFQQAGRLYRDVIRQEPEGSIAVLAREGLKYLPAEQALDHPPRFASPAEKDQKEKKGDDKEAKQEGASPDGTDKTAASVNGNPAAYAPGGLSPQDWMMLQMMMNSGNGGNGGNAAWGAAAPWMMMPSSPGAPGLPGSLPGNAPAIDPEVMKTMLMNQLMQGFDLGGSGKDDRN
jgi:hypothetical protein